MKKLILTIMTLFLLSGYLHAANWHEEFTNTARTKSFSAAINLALIKDVPVQQVVKFAKELGFSDVVISMEVFSSTEAMIKTNSVKNKDIRDTLNKLIMSGIDPAVVEQATSLSRAELEAKIADGTIIMPTDIQMAMNYRRFQQKMAAGKGNKDTGLGYNPNPIGAGRGLALGQMNFNAGRARTRRMSPSAP